MRSKIIAVTLGAVLALSTVGAALASHGGHGNKGPNPQPPKCAPASTPGCSGK